MLCHVCGEPALGQCRLCHQFYCDRHGRQFCVNCRDQETAAVAPPARAPKAAALDRPAAAHEASGPCADCGQPTRRACPLCGRLFCNEHRGWREVRIGRYNLRRPVCRHCDAPAPRPRARLLWLLLALLALAGFGVATYWLTMTPW